MPLIRYSSDFAIEAEPCEDAPLHLRETVKQKRPCIRNHDLSLMPNTIIPDKLLTPVN
jgi:hypothetical protein